MIEITPMSYQILKVIDQLRTQGIEPSAVALPVMPGADPNDQPNATIFGLPVVWLPSSTPEYVMIGIH